MKKHSILKDSVYLFLSKTLQNTWDKKIVSDEISIPVQILL